MFSNQPIIPPALNFFNKPRVFQWLCEFFDLNVCIR